MEKTEGKGLSTLEKSECHPTPGMGLEGRRGVDWTQRRKWGEGIFNYVELVGKFAGIKYY